MMPSSRSTFGARDDRRTDVRARGTDGVHRGGRVLVPLHILKNFELMIERVYDLKIGLLWG